MPNVRCASSGRVRLRWMGLFAAVCCFAVAEPSRSASAVGRNIAGLVQTEADRFVAMHNRDMATLQRILADELVYVHSSAVRQTKAEHLADLGGGRATYGEIVTIEQQPSIYGNIGIIHAVASFPTGAGQFASTYKLRYVSVYVWRAGRWQMLSFNCARTADSTSPLLPTREVLLPGGS